MEKEEFNRMETKPLELNSWLHNENFQHLDRKYKKTEDILPKALLEK